jgi:hypothetical protein
MQMALSHRQVFSLPCRQTMNKVVFLVIAALSTTAEARFSMVYSPVSRDLDSVNGRASNFMEINAHAGLANKMARSEAVKSEAEHSVSGGIYPKWQPPNEKGLQSCLSQFAKSTFAKKCRDPDAQGHELQLALQGIATRANIRVAYLMSPYLYFPEQLLPLICAMPGPIIWVKGLRRDRDLEKIVVQFGIPLDSIWVRTPDQVHELVTSGNYFVIACNDDLLEWWSQPFGKFLGRMNSYRNTITISHGIDEDFVWATNNQSRTYNPADFRGMTHLSGYEEYPYPSLLFTKAAARIRPELYSSATIRQVKELDPNKKTILFLCKETCDLVTSQDAWLLGKEFNLIVSPHPKYKKDKKLRMPKWALQYSAPPDEFPCAKALVETADVIIGQASGIMSMSTHTPEKKLIVLSLTPPGVSHVDVPVLDNATAVMVYEHPKSWVDTVHEALEDTEINRKRQELRASYFNSWFGCIDEYEEYRLFMLALDRNFNLDTSDLTKKYYQIPGATCKMEPRFTFRT